MDRSYYAPIFFEPNFLGAHECPPCGKVIVTAFKGENDYKMDSIKRHILTKNHQNRTTKISKPNKITFDQKQLDAIHELLVLYVAKKNLPFEHFR